MQNLLDETHECLLRCGKSYAGISFIGLSDLSRGCTWEEFEAMADVEYDDGFGRNHINGELVILFKDGSRLARWEYDGSEGWEYITIIRPPKDTGKLTTLFVSCLY